MPSMADLLGKSLSDKLIEKCGEGAVQIASDARAKNMPRLSSGSMCFDAALGGGFTIGRFHTLYGPPSAAKTATALKTLGLAQKCCSGCYLPLEACTCGKQEPSLVALISSENDWDPEWAETLGVDIDRLVFCEPIVGEMGLDVADELIRSGKLDLLVIDSIALLSPKQLIDESTGKDLPGVHARMMGKGSRKLTAALLYCTAAFGRLPTLLCTNQTRINIGVTFGNPEVKTGGQAPQFVASTETRFSKVLYEPRVDPEVALCRFKVTKNKTARAMRAGDFRLTFVPDGKGHAKGDFHDGNWPVTQLRNLGLLKKEGKAWVVAGEEFARQKDAITKMGTDLGFWYRVREVISRTLQDL